MPGVRFCDYWSWAPPENNSDVKNLKNWHFLQDLIFIIISLYHIFLDLPQILHLSPVHPQEQTQVLSSSDHSVWFLQSLGRKIGKSGACWLFEQAPISTTINAPETIFITSTFFLYYSKSLRQLSSWQTFVKICLIFSVFGVLNDVWGWVAVVMVRNSTQLNPQAMIPTYWDIYYI